MVDRQFLPLPQDMPLALDDGRPGRRMVSGAAEWVNTGKLSDVFVADGATL